MRALFVARCPLARVEVSIVFMQDAAQTKGDSALNQVLSQNIRESLAVTRCSLLPLGGFVLPLVDSAAEPQPSQSSMGSPSFCNRGGFSLAMLRPEFTDRLRARHVEVAEQMINAFGERENPARALIDLRRVSHSPVIDFSRCLKPHDRRRGYPFPTRIETSGPLQLPPEN
jgi:hypothetical protein